MLALGLGVVATHAAAWAQCLPSFATPVSYPANGTAPVAVAIGDFNGDGKADLIFLFAGSNAITVRLGNGNGTFGSPTFVGTSTAPLGMAVGDLNGDGRLDVVTANNSLSNVSVLLGNGAGGFGSAVTFPAGSNTQAVTIGDFNGDGRPDLATGNGSSVSVLLANGPATYAAPGRAASTPGL